ncbi:hypothetical protein ACFL2P_01330 [Candidatus Moduliflexota bacterium]
MAEINDTQTELRAAVDHELSRQKATPEERTALEHSIVREQQSKVLGHGLQTTLWSTPLTVENTLRRHRERVAIEKRRMG